MKNISARILNVFVLCYIISYLNIANLSILRYLGLVGIQVIAIITLKDKKIRVNKFIMYGCLLTILSLLVSFFNTSYYKESIIKVLSVMDFFLISFVLLPKYTDNIGVEKLLKNVRDIITVSLVFCYVLFRNDYEISYDTNRIGSLVRLRCGFVHPNQFSIFVFISLLICIYFLSINCEKKKNFIIALFDIFLIYQANSRTAIYSALIFVFLYTMDIFFLNRKGKWIRNIFFIVSCLLGLLFGGFSMQQIDYDYINRVLSYRLTYIENAIAELIETNSLFQGRGAFTNSSLNEVSGVLLDNAYFNYLYQYGLISLLVFIFLIILLYCYLAKLDQKKRLNLFVKNFYLIFLVYSFMENILMSISSLFAILIFSIVVRVIDERKTEVKNDINYSACI